MSFVNRNGGTQYAVEGNPGSSRREMLTIYKVMRSPSSSKNYTSPRRIRRSQWA